MDTVHECDRQTDSITITDTVQRIASRGKKCSNAVTIIVVGVIVILL